MARAPVTGLLSQYAKNAGGAAAAGYWLKFYTVNTTTQKSIFTAITAGSTLSKCTLNSRGEPISNQADDDSTFIPYVDGDYDAYLYETEADADVNNTIASAFLGRHETLPESLSDVALLQFATVNSLISSTSLNYFETIDWADYTGRNVTTVVNNTTSKAGGARYTIKTVAQAASDGDVIDGAGAPNYYGANHALTGGTHVAILSRGLSVDPMQIGATGNGVADDSAQLILADAIGPVIIDQLHSVQSDVTFTNKVLVMAGGFNVDPLATIRYNKNSSVNLSWYNPVADGATDDYSSIRAAIDSRLTVMIGRGQYRSSAALAPYDGQSIVAKFNPQHSIQASESATIIYFDNGVHGIDTDINRAIGFNLSGFILWGASTNGDGKVGVKLGVEGSTAGNSNNIRSRIENVLVIAFDINYGNYGLAYEISFDHCHSFYARTFGFDFADSSTIVDMRLPSCQNGGAAVTNWTGASIGVNSSAIGYNIKSAGDVQIKMDSPRAENNQNMGFQLDGKCKITINSLYCEGNRTRDFLFLSTFNGTLKVDGGRMIHNNAGVTTSAMIEDLSTQPRTVCFDSIEYKIGTTEITNLITYGIYRRSSQTGRVTLLNMSITGDIGLLSSGNRDVVYLAQAGSYAPDVFTIDQFPGVVFQRSLNSIVADINADATPATLNITDGTTTYDMLRGNMNCKVAGELYRYNIGTTTWVKIAP